MQGITKVGMIEMIDSRSLIGDFFYFLLDFNRNSIEKSYFINFDKSTGEAFILDGFYRQKFL